MFQTINAPWVNSIVCEANASDEEPICNARRHCSVRHAGSRPPLVQRSNRRQQLRPRARSHEI